ncbi:MAG: CheR family methyltransferase [Termitinemataceae bacterium]
MATKRQEAQTDLIVVGLGASAGGLEALRDFFKAMPLHSGLAFVVIQHLSPDYKSLMDELLARETKIPIKVADNGMPLSPDTIFLLPPRKNITIFHNRLYLEDQENRKRLNLPIDIFFRSLALDKGKHAIGIVLSGTGSDGMLGIRSIKEAGGMVMAQDERSAKFDGMPKSAIATGLVDYILPPDKMPEALMSFVKHPFMRQNKTLDGAVLENMDTLTRIILLLRDYSGIDFSYYKETTLVRRLERRVSINRNETLEEYLVYLRESDKEKEILLRELLIGVTRFFRDAEAFEALRKKVMPILAGRKSLRIWSAGCSTGEEVYSLAMIVNEYLESSGKTCDVKIFATDIDRLSIEQAGKGFYPDSVMADVDPALLAKYFIRREGGYQVADTIRKMIVFATHNLLKDSPFSRIDLIVCRNLFIYLKPDIQQKLLSTFYYSLSPDGFLFLGASETVGELAAAFECVDPKWKLYRYKAGFQPALSLPLTRGGALELERSVPRISRTETQRMEKLFDQVLSAALPPSVILDAEDNIIHTINDVSSFVRIQPGRFSQKLFDNLPKDLSLLVSSVLRRIKRGEERIVMEKLVGLAGFGDRPLTIEGRAIDYDHNLFYLLSFIVGKEEQPEQSHSITIDGKAYDRILELEKELQFTRENLQATVEELETSNEELQSSNEELIASNEELQSTNEELQSVNEELYTVNTEYQSKIEELTSLNNDMNNLLRNTEVGALYLDRNLCIRRITPLVSKVTNILETDLGRPVFHLSFPPGTELLEQDIRSVMETLQPIDRELKMPDGKVYFARIRPYRTDYNAVDGILITFVDITTLQEERNRAAQMEAELRHRKEMLETILENSPIAKTMVDSTGAIVYINRRAEELFGASREQILKRGYADAAWQISDMEGKPISPENLPFAQIKRTLQPILGYRHRIGLPDGRIVSLSINGTPIVNSHGDFEGAVFAIEALLEDTHAKS